MNYLLIEISLHSQEAKKQDILKAENSRYKSNVTSLSSESSRLHQKLSQFEENEKQYKLKITSLSQQISELSDKYSKLERQKVN